MVPSRPQASVLPRKKIISSIRPPSKLINELKLNKVKSTAWPMLSQDVSKQERHLPVTTVPPLIWGG